MKILDICFSLCIFDFSDYPILSTYHASPISLRLSSLCLVEYITKNVSFLRRITMHGKTLPMYLFCSLIDEWENFIQYLCFPQSTQIAFDSIFFPHKYLDEYSLYPSKSRKDVHSFWMNSLNVVRIKLFIRLRCNFLPFSLLFDLILWTEEVHSNDNTKESHGQSWNNPVKFTLQCWPFFPG